jgi:biotin carboxylase
MSSGAVGGRVLVLGDYRQTVTVVRSLGRAGFAVVLGADDAHSPTALSRYVDDIWRYDNASAQRFCQSVESFLREERFEAVFPVGESQLRRLLGAAPAMESLVAWASPDFATVARCFDKRAMYELAPSVGVPCVPWSHWSGAADWRRRAREMGFPVVVKRKDSAEQVLERKALIHASEAQLEAFLANVQRDPNPDSLLLQKFASGTRHNCHIGAADGRLIAYFQQKVLRTDEADDTGIGVAGVSVAPSPVLRAHCESLTRALAYTGIGCVQFLVDERTGAATFLEFNARMDSTAALPYRMGLDFPLLALRLAVYRRARARGRADAQRLLPAPLPERYRAGVTYHWLHGDLGACLQQLRERRLSTRALLGRVASMAWLALRSYHLTFDWRDPLPTLHMFWRKYLKNPLLRRLPAAWPAAR